MSKNTPLEKQPSSGNVFADIGVADVEEHLIKAGLVKIDQIIRQRGLTQTAAVEAMGIKSAQGPGDAGRSVSRLLRRTANALPGCA